jgi:hypothetical protein
VGKRAVGEGMKGRRELEGRRVRIVTGPQFEILATRMVAMLQQV